MNVPFVDLARIHKPLEKSFIKDFKAHLLAGHFVAGQTTEQFEKEWATFTGVQHALLVNNGTSALFLALEALQLPRGSQVIVPVNTFIATAEAVVLAGLQPVFVDVDKDTYLIDFKAVQNAITKDTKAIIPVNLYGQAVNIQKLRECLQASSSQHILIIEDACQSHGAFFGTSPQLRSDLACYSFYPGKNLGALGEAGAVITNSDTWYERMFLFRGHGSKIKYQHEIVGFNFRANEMEAAFLLTKLPHLTRYNTQRNKAAKLYAKHLRPLMKQGHVRFQEPPQDSSHVYHLFELYTQNREQLMQYLAEKGVQTGLHYPTPLHQTQAFASGRTQNKRFPVAEDLAQHLVSLPIFAGITNREVKTVCEAITAFYETV